MSGAHPETLSAGFDLVELARINARDDDPWHQFFENDALYAGIYELAAGEEDLQEPHDEDEIYVVMKGRSRFTAGDEQYDAAPGSVLFVKAGTPHKFHDIEEDLQMIVVFSKARPAT